MDLNTFNKISNIFSQKREKNQISIKEIDVFDENIVPFIDKMYEKHDFIYERTLEYLNWRYCDIRGGDYKVFLAKMDEKIVGYLVSRVKTTDKTEGVIVDFLVDPDFKEAAYMLCATGMSYFFEHGVSSVLSWIIQGHWLGHVLDSFGFLNTRREVGVFLGRQDLGEDKVTLFTAPSDRLHIHIGDHDWI